MKYFFEINKTTEIIFEKLPEFYPKKKCVFVIDKIVADNFPDLIARFKSFPIYFFDAVEKAKSFENLSQILKFFQKNYVNRSFDIIVVGGGVTTDFVGLATSLFMRGCNLILVPTTLLAMVDAVLGGKTAVHFDRKKNAVGSFYPASKIFIDYNFLKTLPKKEIENGWSEIIKTALISQDNLSEMIIRKKTLEEIIVKTIQIKMNICQKDIFDKGKRQFLNFGHTFAHIIEAFSDFKISHGQAVANGIKIAIFFARHFLNIKYDEKTFFLLEKLPNSNLDLSELNLYILENLIASDKKNTDKINIILLKKIGEPFIYHVDDLEKVLFVMKNFNLS